MHDPGAPRRRAGRRQRAMSSVSSGRGTPTTCASGRAGLVSGPEQVEDGAHARARGAARRRGAWRRGSAGANRKAQPASSRLRCTASERRVDAHPERLEHVGAAAAAAHRAVAVLGHGHAAGRDHQRGHGRDVEGAGAVAAGPAGVDGALRAQRHGRARASRARSRRSRPPSRPRTAIAASSPPICAGVASPSMIAPMASRRLVLGEALRRATTRPRWRFRHRRAHSAGRAPGSSAAGRARPGSGCSRGGTARPRPAARGAAAP